jgi:hypothetical protein
MEKVKKVKSVDSHPLAVQLVVVGADIRCQKSRDIM